MLSVLFKVIAEGLGENTKGAETGMYWVPLIVGVTRLLGLNIVWIVG